jgi:HSP20 family protein
MGRDSGSKIDLKNGVLTISSKKKVEHETNKVQHFTRQEFNYQSFCRSFTLTQSVESDKISAKYDNGKWRISIPKKEEAKFNPFKKNLK